MEIPISKSSSSRRWGKPLVRLVIGVFGVGALVGGAILLGLRPRFSEVSASLGASPAKTAPGVVEVVNGSLRSTLLLDGELRAVKSRTVFASTSEEAKITYMPPEGSLIKQGDRVLELDSGTILNRIKEVESKIVAAENELIRVTSTNEAAIRDMDVMLSTLWLAYEEARIKSRVPEGLVARREYQERQLAADKAKTEYDTQLAKIETKKREHLSELEAKRVEKQKLDIQLDKAKNNLDGMNVKAPADGMVIYADHWFERRKIQIGDVVWGGFPLIRLPDLKEMEVLSQVNEVDGPKISVGHKTMVVLDSYPDTEIAGTVKEIAQTAVRAGWMAKAKVFRVVISLDTTLPRMKPGMSARISVALPERNDQMLVPRSAVKFHEDSTMVSLLEGDQSRDTVVTIVGADAQHFALSTASGIKTGDRIRARW